MNILKTLKDAYAQLTKEAGTRDVQTAAVVLDMLELIKAMEDAKLPNIVELKAFPENCNPFQHDAYNMGCQVSGAWTAMFNQHCGYKQDHNLTEEERAAGKPVWNQDPKYIIMVNCRTGQRFRLEWDLAGDITDGMNRIINEQYQRA